MSRLPRVVAWRSDSDISELKDLFYRGSGNHETNTQDPRARALAKVKAYQTRAANLPHSIESTSLLTAAVLNDTSNIDPFTTRMAYSMAIIRFVNGLLDPSQQSQYAIPLHLLAKSLDLPSAFVELRHIATHESLPSLETLREMTTRALDWLWHHYWSHNAYDDNQKQLESISELNCRRDNIKEMLRDWRRLRRSDPSKQMRAGDGSAEGVKFWKLVKKIQSTIEQDEELFVEVLLYKNVLVPSGSDGLKKLSSSIKLFGPLFEYIKNTNNEGFIQRITLYCINLLNSQKTPMDWSPSGFVTQNEDKSHSFEPHFFTCICEWVKYFLIPSFKKKQLGINSTLLTDVDEILRELLILPREWNVDILQYYLDKTSTFKKPLSTLDHSKLSSLVQQMASQVEYFNAVTITPHDPSSAKPDEQRKRVRETDNQVEEYTKRLKLEKKNIVGANSHESNDTEQHTGWSTVENWAPRPIGVL